jgi:putative peptidoglycan lipid II flippase
MSEAASGRQVARTASLLALLSLLSKPVNFLRDIVVAAIFGTSAAKDAFLVAWALPDLFAGLVTEGLSGVLVPIFSEFVSKGDEKRAWRIASSITNAIIVILSLAAIVVVIAAPLLVKLLAPAFPPDTQALAVRLTRLMAISMVFMGLQGLISSVLNAHQRFVAPALVPVALNLSVTAFVWVTADRLGIDSLALAMVVGTLVTIFVQLPRLPWDRLRYTLTIDIHDEGTRRFARLVGPLLLGTLILSSTSIINRIFGSFLPAGSLAALDFALRTTGPAYVIAPALATVLLPTLSRQASLGQWDDFHARLTLGVKMLLLVMLPAAAGFILLSVPIVRLLFQRGAFDAQSTAMTAAALSWYALGLVSYALYYLLINTFYALQNTVIRIQAGLVLVATYIAANVVLIGVMGMNAIALSYGLAHTVACVLLLARLGQRLGWHVERDLLGFALRLLAAVGVMSAALLGMRLALGAQVWTGGFLPAAAATLAAIVVAVAVYAAALWLLGVTEVRSLRDVLRRKV